MDISQKSNPKSQDEIPVRPSVATSESAILGKFLWLAYIERPIPSEKFSWECLPAIEVSNLLCYLVFTQISSLRPWKVWIRTARWFLVYLLSSRERNRRQNCCGQGDTNDSLLDHCRKCPSQPSSGKIFEFWKLLTVKQQTDLTTLHLV